MPNRFNHPMQSPSGFGGGGGGGVRGTGGGGGGPRPGSSGASQKTLNNLAKKIADARIEGQGGKMDSASKEMFQQKTRGELVQDFTRDLQTMEKVFTKAGGGRRIIGDSLSQAIKNVESRAGITLSDAEVGALVNAIRSAQ